MKICNSYTMVCVPHEEINPQDLEGRLQALKLLLSIKYFMLKFTISDKGGI